MNGGSRRLFLFQIFNGGHKAVVRPDPFPNSAVKRCIADGSACIACARVGRRRFLLCHTHFVEARSLKFELCDERVLIASCVKAGRDQS